MGFLNDIFTTTVQILIAAAICIWGIVILVRLLRDTEKQKLDTWLGFLKFFLGTFVIGLLGFFAKISFETRQMAVTESEQIGKYVEKAMLDNLESRIRFAQYFKTVLPPNHTTGWQAYYETLIMEDSLTKLAESTKKSIKDTTVTKEQIRDNLLKEIDDLTKEAETTGFAAKDSLLSAKGAKLDSINKDLESLYKEDESIQITIAKADNLNKNYEYKGNASISTPDDFITCEEVRNLMPYGRTSSFKKGKNGVKVYIHAFINSPKTEVITIIWKDAKGNDLNRINSTVGINTGRGYRLYDHIRIKNSGEYSVEMENKAGDQMAFKKFVVK